MFIIGDVREVGVDSTRDSFAVRQRKQVTEAIGGSVFLGHGFVAICGIVVRLNGGVELGMFRLRDKAQLLQADVEELC